MGKTSEIKLSIDKISENKDRYFDDMCKEIAKILHIKPAAVKRKIDYDEFCGDSYNSDEDAGCYAGVFEKEKYFNAETIENIIRDYFIKCDETEFIQSLANDFSFWDAIVEMVMKKFEYCIEFLGQPNKKKRIRTEFEDAQNKGIHLSNQSIYALLCAVMKNNDITDNFNSTVKGKKGWFTDDWDTPKLSGSVNRLTVFQIAFAFKLTPRETSDLLLAAQLEDFDIKNYEDAVYAYCLRKKYPYNEAIDMIEKVQKRLIQENAFSFKYDIDNMKLTHEVECSFSKIFDDDRFIDFIVCESLMTLEQFAAYIAKNYDEVKEAVHKFLGKAEVIAEFDIAAGCSERRAKAIKKVMEAHNYSDHFYRVTRYKEFMEIYGGDDKEHLPKGLIRYLKIAGYFDSYSSDTECDNKEDYSLFSDFNIDVGEMHNWIANTLDYFEVYKEADPDDETAPDKAPKKSKLFSCIQNEDYPQAIELILGDKAITAKKLRNILEHEADISRNDIVLIFFLKYILENSHDDEEKEDDDTENNIDAFVEWLNAILEICRFRPFYLRNTLDRIIYYIICNKKPLSTFRKIISKVSI